MKCENCGNSLIGNETSCPNCGRVLNNSYPNMYGQNNMMPNNYNSGQVRNEGTLTNKHKAIIISLLLIIIFLLGVAAFLINNNDKTLKDGSRTIMIYMVGSNLESESKIATYDIDSIDPEKIDLEKNHILLYTGGTEKWHNFVKNDENGLYLLTEEGFEKLKSYEKKNMGDPETLQSLLDYGYENYESQYYDLILYNHGGAIQGAIYDDFTKDNLSLDDFSLALENSKFNEKNKLDTVLFRTCLNGTIEVANTFAPYANYLIASEEITNGGESSVLNFLNDIETSDTGLDYGKKYIEAYEKQINDIDPLGFGTMPMYAVIDLSKIGKVKDLLNEFIESVDLKENYSSIVKVRSKLYQYGYTSFNIGDYDTVDLYTLVEKLSKYSDSDGKELLTAIEDAVLYNWTKQDESHGISIYFPYNANKVIQNMFLKVYKDISNNDTYYNFIGQFNSLSTSKKPSSFANTNISQSGDIVGSREFTLQLTEEQKKDYANSIYIIFRKADDGLYQPIYSSDNTEISDEGVLKTNIANNLIKLSDVSDPGFEGYLTLVERNMGSGKTYSTTAVLTNFTSDNVDDWKSAAATVYFDIKDGVPSIASLVEIDSANGVSGSMLDINDYNIADFAASSYRILDSNGNYSDNWSNDGIITSYEVKVENIKLRMASLDDNEEYFCVFKIRDIYGNEYYSKLLNIK